jgi:hypothetical protein
VGGEERKSIPPSIAILPKHMALWGVQICRNRQFFQIDVTRWHSGTLLVKSLSNKHLTVCHGPAELAQWQLAGHLRRQFGSQPEWYRIFAPKKRRELRSDRG